MRRQRSHKCLVVLRILMSPLGILGPQANYLSQNENEGHLLCTACAYLQCYLQWLENGNYLHVFPMRKREKKSTVYDAKHFTLKQMRACHLCQRGRDWRLLRQARHKEAHTALPLSREDCPVVHLIAVEGRMLVMGCWGEWLERLISGFYAKYKHRHEVLCTSVGYSVWRQW